tara:strand:- start:4473 stop:5153 length:681 start_codon:yes stop_codon:yes gene_type:complete
MEKSVINKIKTILNMEIHLEQMTLENGTVIEAEAFEAGASVFIVTEDGQVALPVGEYELPEGKTLVVSEEGVIDEMKASEEVAEVEVEVEAEEVAPEVAEETIAVIEEVETAVVEQVTAIIDAATPAEVTVEDSEIIAAEVIAEVIAVIEESTSVEMARKLKASLRNRKAKLSAKRKVTAKKQKPARKAIKPNPEKDTKRELKFQTNKFSTTESRVMSKIANIKKH